MNTAPQTAVLLDLDGTLTDPYRGISRCIIHALQSLGCPQPDGDGLRSWIGPTLISSFTAWFETCGFEGDAEVALDLYRQRFAERGLYENEVYDGVPRVLSDLSSAGFELYLATAKPVVYARRILEHFDLLTHFSGVYGAELDGRNSDKTDLLTHILRQESLDPAHCVMVGDRHHDIDAAGAHGIYAIGVLWGYGGRAELASAGASVLIEQVSDLQSAIEQHYRRD